MIGTQAGGAGGREAQEQSLAKSRGIKQANKTDRRSESRGGKAKVKSDAGCLLRLTQVTRRRGEQDSSAVHGDHRDDGTEPGRTAGGDRKDLGDPRHETRGTTCLLLMRRRTPGVLVIVRRQMALWTSFEEGIQSRILSLAYTLPCAAAAPSPPLFSLLSPRVPCPAPLCLLP